MVGRELASHCCSSKGDDSEVDPDCGYDGTLQIWQATTGNHIATYSGNTFLFGLSWSPDSKRIVVGGNAPTVWILDASTGNVIYTYDAQSNQAADVAWSSDGTRIAVGTHNQAIHIFNAADGTNIYTYNRQSGNIDAVVWSSDSKHIASGSNNGTVQVWQAV
jgi:eukaryotic-like serine/threonine-protein kinase